MLIIGCGSKVWMERKAALCSISVPVLCLTLLCILSACSNFPQLGFSSSSAAVLQSLLLSVLCCSACFANIYSALRCTVLLKALKHWSIVPALLCTGSHILEQSRCKITVEWLLAMCGHHHHHCIVCVVCLVHFSSLSLYLIHTDTLIDTCDLTLGELSNCWTSHAIHGCVA